MQTVPICASRVFRYEIDSEQDSADGLSPAI